MPAGQPAWLSSSPTIRLRRIPGRRRRLGRHVCALGRDCARGLAARRRCRAGARTRRRGAATLRANRRWRPSAARSIGRHGRPQPARHRRSSPARARAGRPAARRPRVVGASRPRHADRRAVELAALGHVCATAEAGGRRTALGSHKAGFGHLGAAAGLVSLARVVACCENSTISPTAWREPFSPLAHLPPALALAYSAAAAVRAGGCLALSRSGVGAAVVLAPIG